MDSSSMIVASPSFSRYSSNNLADIADRVVQELRTENGLDDDIFDFGVSDDIQADNGEDDDVNTNTHTENVKENDPDADEQDFEFPTVCGEDSNSSLVSPDEVLTEGQISLRYPVFDRSLLLDVDHNFSKVVDSSETDSTPAPVARLSLSKLLSQERDSSSSSSEEDDLDGIMPGTYCVWKPKTEPPQPRGTHKKSNSISIGNTSKKWKVRDLLKRSYSDDNYSTSKETPIILFTPPITTKQTTNNEKVKKIEKIPKVSSAVDGSAASTKTDNRNIPAHKAKASGDYRLPPYLPYRPDQVRVFAYTGSSKNLYRY